jgi:PPOX class probable F420-dependent enzyme
VSPRVDVSMSQEEALAFLNEPRTGILSTMGRDGYPHLVGMWFAPAPGEIRMWAYAKSQKVLNLRRDQRAALLVESGEMDYEAMKGVLVRGEARLISSRDEIVSIGRALYERYVQPRTGVAFEEGPNIETERQAAKRVGIALTVERLASWDHSKMGT